MASINYTLSAKSNINDEREILIRFTHGRINQRVKTSIFISSEYWDAEKQRVIVPNFRIQTIEKRELKEYISQQSEKLENLSSHILRAFNLIDKSDVSKDWLKQLIVAFNFPTKQKQNNAISFFDAIDEYLDKRDLSIGRKKHYDVLKRILKRYEMFIRITENNNFRLDLNSLSLEVIESFEDFLINEHKLYDDKTKDIIFSIDFNSQRKISAPKPRGINTINSSFKMFRSFINWAVDTELTTNNPFKKHKLKPDTYGTPYYITIDERNLLYQTDLFHRPQLAIQRDIFIFQCLIGCRISDLYKFTNQNVIEGAIEYIPQKTKEERSLTVRVPLNSIAQELLLKYKDESRKKLFPFISEQKYNDAIKEMFLEAGLTRPITIINSVTSEAEVRPLNEVASSHLARRTFIGNLYKQVKDPNLVGSLSGHKEGSKAFARYRDIDEDMKKDLVKLLE